MQCCRLDARVKVLILNVKSHSFLSFPCFRQSRLIPNFSRKYLTKTRWGKSECFNSFLFVFLRIFNRTASIFPFLTHVFSGVKTGKEDKFSLYPLPLRYLSISDSRMSMIPFPSTALEMGKYPKVEGSSMVWKIANTNNYNVLLPIIIFTQVQITPSHVGGIKSRWYPPHDYTAGCWSPWTKTAGVGCIVLHEVDWLRVIKKPSHVFINILIKKINNN